MDLLTSAGVGLLAQPDGDGESVSIFMPTHRVGTDAQGDPLRFRNLLTGVQAALLDRDMRRPDVDALLAPAWELQQDSMAWRHMSDGLAVFLRRDRQRVFRVPVALPELATVGDRFVIGPLLGLVSGDEHFLLLALSQRQVRLLEGSRDHVDVVELDEVPTSLLEVTEPAEPRSHAMARSLSGGGRAASAVFYGHGARDASDKKDEVQGFLRQVADGVREYLGGSDLPMVLAGLTETVAMYREVNTYPHVLPDAIEQNPDDLSAEDLHQAAWPIIARGLEDKGRRTVAKMAEVHGTGLASTDPQLICEAARDGRVATLLLSAGPGCWERASFGSPAVVRLGADDAFAPCERLDQAAADTLARGGEVHAVPADMLTDGSDVAAVFRY